MTEPSDHQSQAAVATKNQVEIACVGLGGTTPAASLPIFVLVIVRLEIPPWDGATSNRLILPEEM